MNEFKGTPGPWEALGDLVYFGREGGISLRDAPMPEENARLIAAAPDLLYALTAALEELDTYAWVAHPKGADGAAYFNVARSHARAAIAKALGEQK